MTRAAPTSDSDSSVNGPADPKGKANSARSRPSQKETALGIGEQGPRPWRGKPRERSTTGVPPKKTRNQRALTKRVTHAISRRSWKITGPRKEQWRAIAKWLGIGTLVMVSLGTASLAAMFWYYGSDSDLPQIENLRNYQAEQVKKVVTPDGVLIGEIFQQRRSVVAYRELPTVLVNAIVSAEDKGFWQHEGIDYLGMVRAAIVNVRAGEKKQGASTITQQVVKNLMLSRKKTFRRKFQEIILARRLEKELSKEEILMLYANVIFFGHGRYGVQEASRYYFGKDSNDLNAGEAAVLAGLPKGPGYYSPKKSENHQRAKERQIYVLQEMTNNGYLTAEVAQKWVDEPIRVIADESSVERGAPEFVEAAKAELENVLGKDELSNSGATVVTSVDLDIQALALKSLRKNLQRYDQRKGYGRAIKKLKQGKLDLELSRLAKKRGGEELVDGKVYSAVVLAVHDQENELTVDVGDYKASILLGGDADKRFNPEGQLASKRFSPGHVIRVMVGRHGKRGAVHESNELVLASGPEGAVVVLDPDTRRVYALIGGYHVKLAGFNRATMAHRQAGSTFKPFVYAAAIDSGDFSAASIVDDAPEVYDLWKPENYQRGVFAGPVRLREALSKSINTVAIRVTNDIGPDRVRELAYALGIKSRLPAELSLALGSGEVTPLELTNAFASFATGGRFAPPRLVQSVGEHEIVSPEGTAALRPEVAYIVLDMMRAVMTEGTGAKSATLGLDLAGKTGTSNKARDAWFVGMSPGYVVGVWIGFDDFGRGLGAREGGSKTALPVFIDIMAELGERSSRFSIPPGIVEVDIDKKTGLRAADGAAPDSRYSEVFVAGSEPTAVAPKAGEVGADDAIFDQYGDIPDAQSAAPIEVAPEAM